jgi:drug/metabolite transporter (DMT)-like permease
MFAFYLLFAKQTMQAMRIPKEMWIIALGVIALEFVGHFSYGRGVFLEQSAIINPISFSYPIVAASLAHVMFKERLEKTQYLGIALTLIGIILLAV